MSKRDTAVHAPKPAAAERTNIADAPSDPVAERLYERGLVGNRFRLADGTILQAPDASLNAPWNLPPRMFRFPMEVRRATDSDVLVLGIHQPDLAQYPYVLAVGAALAAPLALTEPNAYQRTARCSS